MSRGPREKFQALIGSNKTGKAKADFSDSDEDEEETKKSASRCLTKTPIRRKTAPTKAKPIMKVPLFEKVIIQRYLEKPALYMNRKFDIRAYMIILCSKPWFVISNPGYARVCLTDFTMANFG